MGGWRNLFPDRDTHLIATRVLEIVTPDTDSQDMVNTIIVITVHGERT